MTDWQPIETALKDGRPIFAMLKHGQTYVMRYLTPEAMVQIHGGELSEHQEGWYEWEDDDSSWAPSWWMPVEKLPAEVLENLDIRLPTPPEPKP